MILKNADDLRNTDIAVLDSLQEEAQSAGNESACRQIGQEIRNIRTGLQGERQVAHFLNHHYAKNDDVIVIHDLRVVVDNGVAQIDHIVINRRREVYLLETKGMRGGIERASDGQWYRYYGSEQLYRTPIADPIAQGERHAAIIRALLLDMRSCMREVIPVLVVRSDTEVRADLGKHESAHIIAADRFAGWLENRPTIKAAATAIYQPKHEGELNLDELFGVASRLLQRHEPIQIDWRARFDLKAPAAPPALLPAPADTETPASDLPAPEKAVSPFDRYLDRFISRNAISIPGGQIVIYRHEDDMRTVKAEGDEDFRISVSRVCKANGGEWIADNKTWLMTYAAARAVVDQLRPRQAEREDDAPKGGHLPLPPMPAASVLKPVLNNRSLFQFHTDDGLVRVLRLPEKNYVLRTDNNEMNNVRIAAVCRRHGVGEWYEERGNWLVPKEPPDLIQRLCVAIIGFKHDKVG